MTAPVRAGFFSFTEVTEPDQHRAYNEWHQLDHLPEQFQIPGIVFGQRWVVTPDDAKRSTRIAPLDRVHYVTLYLMTEPLGTTLTRFVDLGAQLRRQGRFHQFRHSHLGGAFELASTWASPEAQVSAAVVPWRPHRGIYLQVDHSSSPSAPIRDPIPGSAGCWRFGPGIDDPSGRWSPGDRTITVWFLDDDPLVVADRLAPPGPDPARSYRGPLHTIDPGHWDWFD